MTEQPSVFQPLRPSIFGHEEPKGFPWVYRGVLEVERLAGGTPTDPNVAEAWIKSKGYQGALKDEQIRQEVGELMKERGWTEERAIEEVAKNRILSGFKRDKEHGLYIEGRQLKACIKEAASVAADAGKLQPRGVGETNNRKGLLSFVAEHVFVREQRLYLKHLDGTPVTEPTEVDQSFVHTWRGSGIQLTEIVEPARIEFTVETDKEWTDEELAMIWLTAQRQGIGASRSQGNGRFVVAEWELISSPNPITKYRKANAATRRKATAGKNGGEPAQSSRLADLV